MVKENNKGTTNEDLAVMISRGFQDMDERFQDVDEKMVSKNEFNTRMDAVDTRLSKVEKKVDKLDYQVDEVYDILKRFEENDILNLQKRVQTLEKVVKTLANQISAK